jgi:hypothetical protein
MAAAHFFEMLRIEPQDLVMRYSAAILRVAEALERHAVLRGDQASALVFPKRHA